MTCLEELLSNHVAPPGFCGARFDAVLCWPESPANTSVEVECPVLPPHTFRHAQRYAVRLCRADATWEPLGDYTQCIPAFVTHDDVLTDEHVRILYTIYWVGYTLSLILCLFALSIFVHYRNLWCLRNIIHSNIILCFTLHNTVWLLYSLLKHELKFFSGSPFVGCLLPLTLLKYFICSAFFWMFVEGLYIFVNVFFSLHAPKIRFWTCATIGWGFPFVLIVITLIAGRNKLNNPEECMDWTEAYFDFIIIGPMLLLIFLNFCFLCVIMYLVMSKLRLSVRTEFEIYKKGIRALLILCPLLGINYAVTLIHPLHPRWLSLLFHYYSVLVSSVQGTLVALFFCFRNKEVQDCLGRSITAAKLSLKLRQQRKRNAATRERRNTTEHSQITLLSLSHTP